VMSGLHLEIRPGIPHESRCGPRNRRCFHRALLLV
jgi:hypothetical protein